MPNLVRNLPVSPLRALLNTHLFSVTRSQQIGALLVLSLLVLNAFPAKAQMGEAAAQPVGTPSATSALKIGTGSQRVPAGTMLTIAFNTAMDSKVTNMGDVFTAYTTQDFTMPGLNGHRRLVLPSGTIIRGRVSDVKRPSFFSKGGSIALAFDHAMLPSGDLMPLSLNLSTDNTIVKQGVLYTDPGIGKKLGVSVEDGKKTFSNITEQGVQAGKQIAGGLGTIITVPAAAVGGALAGTAVTTGKTAVAIVGKGETVAIKPGDTVTIDFGGTFNLPSE
jgi:hypothetical protein